LSSRLEELWAYGPPKVMKKRFGSATTLYGTVALSFVIPSTRISYFTALSSATYVVLPKENHMQLTEAATLDRKSGKPRDLQFRGPLVEMFFDRA
jgi:hypothetical protein